MIYFSDLFRPPPPPNILHQWKQRRTKVGSQCSWLMLKISMLDEKISSLQDNQNKMKTERQAKLHDQLASKKSILPTEGEKTQSTAPELESSDGASSIHVCSRTRPFSNKQHHKYVKKEESIVSPAPYNCRCLHGYSSCRLCSNRNTMSKIFSKNRAELCDMSYHPVLSNDNGKCLFLT